MDEQNIPVATPVNTNTSGQGGGQAEGASTRAILALIFGILSLLCAGFLSGIPAIILGKMEMNAIKAGLAPKAGEGTAKVGFILGIIGTALSCLVTLFSIGIIIFSSAIGGMQALKNTSFSI
jgi:hypothetical protein